MIIPGRTWIVNRIGAVVREKGERWLEEVSSEPPVAAGAQLATGGTVEEITVVLRVEVR